MSARNFTSMRRNSNQQVRIAKLLKFDDDDDADSCGEDGHEPGMDLLNPNDGSNLNSSGCSGHMGISEEDLSDDTMEDDHDHLPLSLRRRSDISSSGELNHSIEFKFTRPSTRELVKSKGDTPPYKRVRALRLFESPQSPKSLLQIAQCQNTADAKINPSRSRLFASNVTLKSTPTITKELPERRIADSTKNNDVNSSCEANVNPFTPSGMMLQNRLKKRRKTYVLNG